MSEVFRFLHLADVHLDTPFRARRSALRATLREAGWRSFAAALDSARRERCDAVIIAGDLFDEDRVAPGSEARLLRMLGEVAADGVAVILATGNHDPGGTEGRLGALAFPPGVTCFRHRRPMVRTLRRRGEVLAHIVGVGHETARESASLAAFPARPGPEPTVGVMHALVTSAEGAAGHDRYAPCTTAELDHFDGDYWALGHVHTRQRVSRSPAAWYPGNLQGRHFGETGARGGLLVEIPRRGDRTPRVRFVPFARVRWELLEPSGLEQLRLAMPFVETVEAQWRDRRRRLAEEGDPAEGFLLRIAPRGPCPLARELADEDERRDLAEHLRERLGPDILDLEIDPSGWRVPLDVDALRGRDDLLGAALRDLDRRVAAGEASWDDLVRRPQRLASRLAREGDASLASGIETILAEAFRVEEEG